jgi:hypothetical protein
MLINATVSSISTSDVVVDFGALTRTSAGGVAVTGTSISSGDASGHWQIVSNVLTPSATGEDALTGTYNLTLDDAQAVDITTVANKFSAASTAEISAAYTAATASTDTGILIRGGDYSASSRITLGTKAFTSTFTIEPHGWTENADPRNSTRNVILPGITISATCSNITIQGCEIFDNDGAVGVVMVTRPSTNIITRQNEIHSSPLLTEYTAGRMAAGTMTTIEGVSDNGGTGVHTRMKTDENYIHDVTRGAEIIQSTDNATGPSSVNGNYFEDCYQFYTICSGISPTVGTLAATIYDNKGHHVWSTTADSGAPHSSVGLSFDPDIDGLNVMGNLMNVGYNRIIAEPGFVTGATGAKFNNPDLTDSYQNIKFAFNTIVSHGLCIEFAGADGIEIFNNTVLSEDQNGGTFSTISFEGAANVKLWNNIAENYGIGSWDGIGDKGGTPVFVTTLDTLRGYGNIHVDTGSTDYGRNTVFQGNAGVFSNLTFDQLETAFTPEAGTYPLTATEKKGAIGTGYYSGLGVHTAPAWSDRVATGGTPYSAAFTTWDGTDYATKTGGLANVANTKEVTIAWEGNFHADNDASGYFLFHETGSRISLRHLGNGKLRFRLEAADGSVAYSCDTEEKVAQSASGTVRMAFSIDLADGRGIFALNGKTAALTPIGSDGPMQDIAIAWSALGTMYIGTDATGAATKYKGNFGGLLVMDEFVDLDTVAGLNQLFASTGAFRDWGADGTNISAGTKPLVFRGNAAALNGGTGNGGDGGAFTMTGTVVDV